jgi:hypothetical protein
MECNAIDLVAIAGRFVIGILLSVSGILKARQPGTASAVVSQLFGVQPWVSTALVRGLSAVELAVGLLIVIGISISVVSVAAGFFFVLVNIPILLLLNSHYGGGCGCFGDSDRRIRKADIARNCILSALALGVAYLTTTEPTGCASVPVWSLAPATIATAGAIAAVVALSWALGSDTSASRDHRGWVGE